MSSIMKNYNDVMIPVKPPYRLVKAILVLASLWDIDELKPADPTGGSANRK
jgi:hypothetical protein